MRTVHEHEKPFVCAFEGCGQAFGFKKVLQRHELVHTQPALPKERKKRVKVIDLVDEIVGTGYEESGRDINCTMEGCQWRFTRDHDLKRHLVSMHGHKSEEESDMQDVDYSMCY